MTVAKAMKSPGQKLKSPKGKGPATPNLKSPKGKGTATPKGTPSLAKTPKGTPTVAKTPKGTPTVAKTPKGTPTVAKTPKGTPFAAKTPKGTPVAKALNGTPATTKTPKGTPFAAKTPKGTPFAAKTPKGTPVAKALKETPNVAKTPKRTPATAKTPKGTPVLAKTPKGTPTAAKTPKGTPTVAKTPKGTPTLAKTPKGTPTLAKTPKRTPRVAKTPKGTPSVAKSLEVTPGVAKTLQGTAKVAKTPNVGNKQISNGSPKIVKTPFTTDMERPDLKRKREDVQNRRTATLRKVRVGNLSRDARSKVRDLLTPRGEIVQIKGQGNYLVVEFRTVEEARAAKELNGALIDGRHLTITHVDDTKIPINQRVSLSNFPHDLNDEDIWSAFGRYGKITHVNSLYNKKRKTVIKCSFSFETAASAKKALSEGSVNIRGNQVKVSPFQPRAYFPITNTVFINGFTPDVTEEDIIKFLRSAGPVSGVRLSEQFQKVSALVNMTNVADVEKALQLNNTELKNKVVKVVRHRKAASVSVKEEVPAKKQRMNNGVAKAAVNEGDDASDSDSSEADELAAFQGQLQKLNAVEGSEDDDEEENDDDDDEEDDDDDDEEDDDDDDEEDDDDDEEADDDDDEEEDDNDEEGDVDVSEEDADEDE